MQVAMPSMIPCRTETETILARSHECVGSTFHNPKNASVPTELTLRRMLTKNAGMAYSGALSGLTLKITTRREVSESRAEAMMPKRREVTGWKYSERE